MQQLLSEGWVCRHTEGQLPVGPDQTAGALEHTELGLIGVAGVVGGGPE